MAVEWKGGFPWNWDLWQSVHMAKREPKPPEDAPETPLATERQNGVETGSACGPGADPPKEPTESKNPTSA